jgi:3D (Asp-Asp-Asp) domain-containing protein/lysozyme family protein
MYQSLPRTSSTLASVIRNDIFSLLGNSGKTLFTPDSDTFSFSFRFFFSSSLRRIVESIDIRAHRRLLTYITLCILTLFALPTETSFAAETVDTPIQRTFIVTAYYSPVRWQQNYYRGSYEADIRLNGNGTHGASGTPVFTGMIAAPKTYAFGTQIFFEGLGLGTVEDRGWAIVEALVRGQAYDRIDLWMGYGDAGLRRTIVWGRREVRGTIVTDTKKRAPIDLAGIDNGSIDLDQFSPTTSPGSIGGLSADVVSAFADLGYHIIGSDVASMLIQFQLDQHIISSKDETGAGNYGPRTKAALLTLYTTYETERNLELQAIETAKQKLLTEHDTWQAQYTKAQEQVQAWGQPRLWSTDNGIRSFQEWLRDGQYYRWSITGQMTPQTLAALRKYQKSKNIKATGKLDEATKSAMIDDMVAR